MNYRHLYHAGNFADVFKHCVLVALVQYLLKKDKPFLFLDTHAGIGKYDLTSNIARKTQEFTNGIAKIYNTAAPCPLINTYKNIVHAINANTEPLHFYPGSPLIVRKLLRKNDTMILAELHHEDINELKQQFYNDKKVAVHHTDGYQSLKAFLPPKCGRGLILIDPSFEETNEFDNIIAAIKTAIERFSTGIFAIWHPIKDPEEVKKFYSQLKTIPCKNILALEFSVSKSIADAGLTSCGMVIINPPWQIENELRPALSWLCKTLAQDASNKFTAKFI